MKTLDKNDCVCSFSLYSTCTKTRCLDTDNTQVSRERERQGEIFIHLTIHHSLSSCTGLHKGGATCSPSLATVFLQNIQNIKQLDFERRAKLEQEGPRGTHREGKCHINKDLIGSREEPAGPHCSTQGSNAFLTSPATESTYRACGGGRGRE